MEPLKSGPWGKFQAIQGLVKSTNQIRIFLIKKTLWLLHKHLFLQISIEKRIIYIQFLDCPIPWESDGEDNSYYRRFNN